MIWRRLRAGRLMGFSQWLLAIGCRRRSAVIVALSWSLATLPLEPPRFGRRGCGERTRSGCRAGRGPRLIVLHKAGGTEDILAAAAARTPEETLRLATLPRNHVKAVFRALVGEQFPTLTDFDYRAHDPEVQSDKDRYRDFLERVVRFYARLMNVGGFTTAAYNYRAERELAAASSAAGVPFIAIQKESVRSPTQRQWFTLAYRDLIGPFGGSAVAVYSEEDRASLIAGDVADARDIVVVGCPRIDVLHQLRTTREVSHAPPEAPVVLFSVDSNSGAWTPLDGRRPIPGPRWERLASATEMAFVAAAREHRERPFVIKTKIGMEAQQLGRLPEALPENLRIVSGGLATGLLKSAAVVVGFNSTTLLESLAAGIPTVMPRFEEARDAGGWVFALEGAVQVVEDPRELPGAVTRALSNGFCRELTCTTREVLERYVGNADGGASRRAWELLQHRVVGVR